MMCWRNKDTKISMCRSRRRLRKRWMNMSSGRAEPKQALAVAVYNHYKRIYMDTKAEDVELQKSNILLVGPTGDRENPSGADAWQRF